jgi:hypothetical protein
MLRSRPFPKQRTSLRRKEWTPVPREERPLAPVRRLERPVSYSGGVSGVAVPKENVLESAAYENAVRGLGYCVRCGRTCRPQFCHADQGKGTGIKTDVRRGWAGCGYWSPEDLGCHYIVGTSGQLPKQERRDEEDRLAEITRGEVLRRGTWPKSVPMYEETTA